MRFSVSEAKGTVSRQISKISKPSTQQQDLGFLFSISLPKTGRIELGLKKSIIVTIG